MADSSLYKSVQPAEYKDALDAKISEDALARRQYDQFVNVYQGHRTWVNTALKYDNFYYGDQWSAADSQKLTNEGRPALTINMILSTVNVVLGEQITSRLDIQYKHRKNGSAQSGFALTKMAMAILEAAGYKWLETTVFSDGLIMDRGYFDLRMDWSESLEGKPKVRVLNPMNVIPDPQAQDADPDTWNEWWYTDWVSLDYISVNYGEENAEKLKCVAEQGQTYGVDSVVYTSEDKFGKDFVEGQPINEDPVQKRTVRSVRIIERQYKVSTRVHYLVDSRTGQRRALPLGTTASEAKELARQFQAMVHSVTEQRIRWTVTCDRFVLHESWSPYKTFTVVPFFPYFRRGKPFGMVRNLISPQEQFNKLSSQELHIVNSTANSGWKVEVGALHGMTADELAQQGSKTGLVIEVNPGKLDAVEKISPNTIPSGITNIANRSQANINVISGVNAGMAGTESPEVSGVALEKKVEVGQVQLSVVKDNLARTQFFVARKLLELMKTFMGYEQVINYTKDDDATQPVTQEAIAVNQPQEDGTVANNTSIGEYDIFVSSMPDRDTFNEIQFAECIALRSAGIMIPGHEVILYSNLERKFEIAEQIKQIEGLAAPTEEEMAKQAEMEALAMADAQAEIDLKRGKGAQANTAAQLNQVKAQNELLAPQFKQEDANREWAENSRGHKTRIDLARINAAVSLDKEAMKAASKPKLAASKSS